MITREKGLSHLRDGQIIFGVFGKCCSNERRRLISASIGCALPADKNTYGYISEHDAYGQTAEEAGDYAEDLAASMQTDMEDFSKDRKDYKHDADRLGEGGNVVNGLRRSDFCAIARGVRL
ncbi:MAG: hypothetical protein AVW05_03530 [Hadesarchaea archaeon DG-33]|nr:MAG: hypothetical protein AVW05_03530 [Hadesarchaea archaeon DG-33]